MAPATTDDHVASPSRGRTVIIVRAIGEPIASRNPIHESECDRSREAVENVCNPRGEEELTAIPKYTDYRAHNDDEPREPPPIMVATGAQNP